MNATDIVTVAKQLIKVGLDRTDRLMLADWCEDIGESETANALRSTSDRVWINWQGKLRVGAPTGKECESMSGWQIAEVLGCHYLGDNSVIPHDGYFYDSRDWEAFGYVSIVEFRTIEGRRGDEGTVYVTEGTISRPDEDEMRQWFEACGDDYEESKGNVHAQIEVCGSYYGSDDTDTRTFNLATWKEHRIWDKIMPWLVALGK